MERIRKLAAIMFTDIEGYTAMMQQDEDHAISVRNKHRKVLKEKTHRFNGTILQYFGDGTLSIFDSAVDAVQCGIDMQLEFQQGLHVPLRIGIHCGDIIYTHEDIIGDGVNVASRVESSATIGSILISDKVYDEIKNNKNINTSFLKTVQYKNVERPIDLYAISNEGLKIPDPKHLKGKIESKPKQIFESKLILFSFAFLLLIVLSGVAFIYSSYTKGPDIERIAVMPFRNLMNNPTQDHLVQGIHEALIVELQRAGIDVIPFTDMIAYNYMSKRSTEIAKELNVDALVDGSILRNSDNISIEIQIIDGEKGSYIGTQSHESMIRDLFTLYKEVTKEIADDIQQVLSPEVETYLAEETKIDPEAYEWYLKGRYFLNKGDPESLQEAIVNYGKVLEIDPSFEQAYTDMVETYLLMGFTGATPHEAHTQFRVLVDKAIAQNPSLKENHQLQAMIKIFSYWDWEGAEEELQLAMKEEYNSSELYDTYCQFLWAMGRIDESVAAGEKAVALDRENHWASCNLSWAYYFQKDISAAVNQLETTIDSFGSDCPYHYTLGYRILHDTTENIQLLNKALDEIEQANQEKLFHDWWGGPGLLSKFYVKTGRIREARALLEEIDPSQASYYRDPMSLVHTYVALEEYDEAFDLMEKAYLQRSFLLIYLIQIDPWLDPLRSDPRYNDLLKKLGMNDTINNKLPQS